jgi:cadmium resistance protein CadD (predicted permease)
MSLGKRIDESPFLRQLIPVSLSSVIVLVLGLVFYLALRFIDLTFRIEPVVLTIRFQDVLVGATIYLKTAVDFAILMALFMKKNPGWRNRIAIETGTGFGNAVGTLMVAIVWIFFKEVEILLAAMILLAGLVLIELATETIEPLQQWDRNRKGERLVYELVVKILGALQYPLEKLGLRKIIPTLQVSTEGQKSWPALFVKSFEIPFLLGLDDFAGYVPLFNVVNLFGFSLGVILAHSLLNTGLFLAPKRTIAVMEKPLISLFGGILFLGLALYGFYEFGRITGGIIFPH